MEGGSYKQGPAGSDRKLGEARKNVSLEPPKEAQMCGGLDIRLLASGTVRE